MKKIIMLVAGMAVISSAGAQYIRIAPEAGLNLSNVHVTETNGRYEDRASGDIKAGLKIGGVIDIGLSRHFSIQPGLFYSMKGYRLEEDAINGIVRTREDASRKVSLNYLEVPLNLAFTFGHPRDVRFMIGFGGYLAFAVGGKVKYGPYLGSSRNTTEDIHFGDNELNDDYRGFDAGGQVFAGFMLPHGAYFRAQYQAGIANIDVYNDDDFRVLNTTASLTLGFMLGHYHRW